MDHYNEWCDEEELTENASEAEAAAAPVIEETEESRAAEEEAWELPKARIGYVMLIVAVLCGGNGLGIVAAGLFWKASHNLVGAIAIAAGATIIGLLLVLVIVLVHKRRVIKRVQQQKGEV